MAGLPGSDAGRARNRDQTGASTNRNTEDPNQLVGDSGHQLDVLVRFSAKCQLNWISLSSETDCPESKLQTPDSRPTRSSLGRPSSEGCSEYSYSYEYE
eukprot:scaffold164649_cov38-Prasinocladus_malaysianus.AAC.1